MIQQAASRTLSFRAGACPAYAVRLRLLAWVRGRVELRHNSVITVHYADCNCNGRLFSQMLP